MLLLYCTEVLMIGDSILSPTMKLLFFPYCHKHSLLTISSAQPTVSAVSSRWADKKAENVRDFCIHMNSHFTITHKGAIKFGLFLSFKTLNPSLSVSKEVGDVNLYCPCPCVYQWVAQLHAYIWGREGSPAAPPAQAPMLNTGEESREKEEESRA